MVEALKAESKLLGEVVEYDNFSLYFCIRIGKECIMLIRLRTKRPVADEDWKTAIAKNKPIIPKGETVEFVEEVQNLYGDFVMVKYNGLLYFLKKEYLEKETELKDGTDKRKWTGCDHNTGFTATCMYGDHHMDCRGV